MFAGGWYDLPGLHFSISVKRVSIPSAVIIFSDQKTPRCQTMLLSHGTVAVKVAVAVTPLTLALMLYTPEDGGVV